MKVLPFPEELGTPEELVFGRRTAVFEQGTHAEFVFPDLVVGPDSSLFLQREFVVDRSDLIGHIRQSPHPGSFLLEIRNRKIAPPGVAFDRGPDLGSLVSGALELDFHFPEPFATRIQITTQSLCMPGPAVVPVGQSQNDGGYNATWNDLPHHEQVRGAHAHQGHEDRHRDTRGRSRGITGGPEKIALRPHRVALGACRVDDLSRRIQAR